MQVISPFHSCLDCEEVITNPICPSCLGTRMKRMVAEYDPSLAENIVIADIDGETACILCGRGMSICAHCFSKDVYEYLEENNSVIAKEFLSRFDFEIRKKLVDFA